MQSDRQSLVVDVNNARGPESARGKLLLLHSAPESRVKVERLRQSGLVESRDGSNASTALAKREERRVGSIQYSNTPPKFPNEDAPLHPHRSHDQGHYSAVRMAKLL